ncbi:heavy metal transporter [Novimethylophilus kurashikiensis]|uniref:Heavy metal transporter n=1 Tax=Novimethylophilus kurashikiensis TaxID=1825523 RepID=A0A2R5FAL0_9PROT|nr:hypothetical protein [Novimethylophilus kurashikiensis]GBG14588.1 heavy metal transporter [Novimethylophilus kurashikiensis]
MELSATTLQALKNDGAFYTCVQKLRIMMGLAFDEREGYLVTQSQQVLESSKAGYQFQVLHRLVPTAVLSMELVVKPTLNGGIPGFLLEFNEGGYASPMRCISSDYSIQLDGLRQRLIAFDLFDAGIKTKQLFSSYVRDALECDGYRPHEPVFVTDLSLTLKPAMAGFSIARGPCCAKRPRWCPPRYPCRPLDSTPTSVP